jgi:hypothetical protein
MIGRLPVQVRHLLLLLLSAAVTFGLEQLPSLELTPMQASIGTLVLTALLAWVTPLVQGYGLGQVKADATELDEFAEATDNSERPEDGSQKVIQDPNHEYVSDGEEA